MLGFYYSFHCCLVLFFKFEANFAIRWDGASWASRFNLKPTLLGWGHLIGGRGLSCL